ncbi:MAG: DUF5718 family protein [Campylobacterota bacterium]|nr:DUF5718 family protein [Campylobacterota bacterium]
MSKERLKSFIGFGVAGNFAHHLEQAGEASDFVDVKVDDVDAPKGIFPFYLPFGDTFLGTYPLSSTIINHPRTKDGNLQMEPEVALICELIYENEKVIDVIPNFFTAYNDCSIRKDNAKKISEKKNWGEETKGISTHIVPIDNFEEGGVLDNYHIVSFLKRDGIVYQYGEDSAVVTYNYFHTKLKNWIIDKLNTQKDNGPLEDLNLHLKNSSYPEGMIISIGATSYTSFGQSTFLEVGDEVFVYIYNKNRYTLDDINNHIKSEDKKQLDNCSYLHQHVV